jgi:hypothetical protein
MTDDFRLYQGAALPDFTRPLFILSVVDRPKFSRLETFNVFMEVIDAHAENFEWVDQHGFEMQKRQSADTLYAHGLSLVEADIVAKVQKAYPHDPMVARMYMPYPLEQHTEPKEFLIAQRFTNRLPALTMLKKSRCRPLVELVDTLEKIKPLLSKRIQDWNE